MIESCRQFLRDRIAELLLPGGGRAYADEAMFFGDMPRNWLKDHRYGANCLPLTDRKTRDGQIIARERNAAGTHWVLTRRIYTRKILFRCFLHADALDDLRGNTGYVGLAEQFEQAVGGHRCIPDADGHAILVNLHDAARPWDADTARERVKQMPYKAIERVEFAGGIHRTTEIPIIPSIDLVNGVTITT